MFFSPSLPLFSTCLFPLLNFSFYLVFFFDFKVKSTAFGLSFLCMRPIAGFFGSFRVSPSVPSPCVAATRCFVAPHSTVWCVRAAAVSPPFCYMYQLFDSQCFSMVGFLFWAMENCRLFCNVFKWCSSLATLMRPLLEFSTLL